MAEYIKREDVIKAIRDMAYYTDDSYKLKHDCERLPSIDIVRCSECKYWDKAKVNYGGVEHFCNYAIPYTIQADADDYCSFGEQREKSDG